MLSGRFFRPFWVRWGRLWAKERLGGQQEAEAEPQKRGRQRGSRSFEYARYAEKAAVADGGILWQGRLLGFARGGGTAGRM